MTRNSAPVTAQTQRSAGKTIARNTLFGLGAQLILKLANFLFTVLVVRSLGGEQFGQYNIVMDWAVLFSVIGDLGITQYFTREVARDPVKTHDLFWDSVTLRLALAVLSSVATVGGAILLTTYSTDIIIGIAIFTSTYFFQAFMMPLDSILKGNERIDIVSVLTVVQQILSMVSAGIVLYLGFNFVWLFVPSNFILLFILLLQLRAVRRNNLGPPRFRINPSMWWSVIKASLPFAFIQLSLSFAFRVDTIILSTHVTNQAVGWYKVAYNLALVLLGLSTSFNNAILPTLAREHEFDPESVRPWYYRSVKLMVLLGLPIAVGGMLLADRIVETLYQPEIAPAAVALAILVWDIPIVMYHSFCGNVAQSVKRETGAARVYGSLGVVNVLLNLILIPRFGIIGASFSTVLTDLIGAAQFYFLFRHEFGAGLGLNRLLRLALSAALMGAVVLSLRQLNWSAGLDAVNLGVTVAIAGASYFIFVWLSGAFSPEERAQLTGLVTRRLRP